MEREDLIEYVKIEKELEKLLEKFEELNAQSEKIKNESSDGELAQVLLDKLEFQYDILDKKMRELKIKSDKLRISVLKNKKD